MPSFRLIVLVRIEKRVAERYIPFAIFILSLSLYSLLRKQSEHSMLQESTELPLAPAFLPFLF